MSGASIEQMMRFEEEVKIAKAMRLEPRAVGDATQIILSKEFCAKYGLNREARLEFEEGCLHICAGPNHVQRDLHYKPQCGDWIDWAKGYARGSNLPLPADCMDEVQSFKTPEKDYGTAEVENSLFRHLASYGGVCGVNPSFGTAARLIKTTGLVTTTGTDDDSAQYTQDLKDFCKKSQGKDAGPTELSRVQYVRPKSRPDNIWNYYGTHDPTKMLSGRWCYFIPNPYAMHEWKSFKICNVSKGVTIEYEKKHRVVYSFLPDLPSFCLYSPATVKRYLGNDKYFLACSEPMPFIGEEADKPLSHNPFFFLTFRLINRLMDD